MPGKWVAKRLKVYGIVQGVGFRPFIFPLAEVKNTICLIKQNKAF
jgi:hydrogenase maturation factor HypF (carbamoyltransferase family)